MTTRKLIALALAAALCLGLAACGKKAAEADRELSESPEAGTVAPAVTQEPTDSAYPMHSGTPVPEVTPTPDNEPITSAPTQVATPQPSQAATDTPVTSEPTSAPATPEPTPEAKAPTAAEVYAAVEKAAGNSGYYDASSLIESFYDLSADDLEDYRFSMPSMSGKIEETFVAKVKSGKLSAVKSACQSRQAGMVEDAEFYPDTGDYVSAYQLVTEGDWLLFYVGPNASKAADAFKTSVK